jgi:hypothetical protein
VHDEFIPLDRTFHDLAFDASGDDETQLSRLYGRAKSIRWPDLLRENRVILLSEAGSGKTAEVRNIASQLRCGGKQAFFLRIEHVTQDFEGAFEEGTYEAFKAWVSSGQEGWLLLDSVDEARLRDPTDFERAIKKLGRKLRPVLQQAHIIITSRATAWRAKTDLHLCRSELPYQAASKAVDEDVSGDALDDVTTKDVSDVTSPTVPFRIVALDDLQGAQVDAFLKGKNVTDVQAFHTAVERKDVLALTTRPQDLAELIDFWIEHKRIGSRLELIRNSIERRLEERDQKRADARPITKEKLRLGAQLVAAAATLGKQSDIRVPDGSENAKGVPIKDILTDWDDKDCATLLSRPVFDEGIYGTVRFHHRSVREFLTAEWLHVLLKNQGSRSKIERLFFRTQYGMEIVVPTMRPVLPWLILFDVKFLDRVCAMAPEILFEGGDPSQLPKETRSKILRQVCEQLAQPAHGRSMMDYAAVQRFANVDLADDIKTLLKEHREDDTISAFLLRMIWAGEIAQATAEVKAFALDPDRGKYTRQVAFRALAAVGSTQDNEEVRRSLLAGGGQINRDWIQELLSQLPCVEASVDWLLQALERAEVKGRYEHDMLPETMSRVTAEWPEEFLPKWIAGLQRLLSTPPVVERRHCEISQRYGWLAAHAAEAVLRMVRCRNPATLDQASLKILRLLTIADMYQSIGIGKAEKDALQEEIPDWSELNHRLFWHDVAETRASREEKDPPAATSLWQVGALGHLWRFDESSFDAVFADITSRPLADDRLIALALAFSIYVKAGRPEAWRRRLRRITKDDEALSSHLDELFRPAKRTDSAWRKQHAKWERRRVEEAARDAQSKQKWKAAMAADPDPHLQPADPKQLVNSQAYLYQELHDQGVSGKWTEGNWRSLAPEYGEGIARRFRDGAVRYWRHNRPVLRSEGAAGNTYPFSSLFGLFGLAIEAREVQDWATRLTNEEAEIAARYAIQELNGFPTWMPSLYAAHPEAVVDTLTRELDFELAASDPQQDSHYVVDDLSWSGEWLWDGFAPWLVGRLSKPPANVRTLRELHAVVQGSGLPDETLARLASRNAKATRNAETAPLWFSMWVGVTPDVAIPALAARIAEIKGDGRKTEFAMRFITSLLGHRHDGRGARQAYRTVAHMKTLYLLISQHVREQEDIERAGKGVYSPELRDNAQDARNTLFAFIRDAPGKESFLALDEIAQQHPNEATRPWMASYTKMKATQDGDTTPWHPARVREYYEHIERTPDNHRDLWDLACDRLYDLKRDLEDGDSSIASILLKVEEETEMRKFIGNWCRDRATGRYGITQEEELADAKRPDLRFYGVGFDAPIPVELKIANRWTGPRLFQSLEEQLCGNYLRDARSSRGIFLLFYQEQRDGWELPNSGRAKTFDELLVALRTHWTTITTRFSDIDELSIIGVDLTKRCGTTHSTNRKRRTKKAETLIQATDPVGH